MRKEGIHEKEKQVYKENKRGDGQNKQEKRNSANNTDTAVS